MWRLSFARRGLRRPLSQPSLHNLLPPRNRPPPRPLLNGRPLPPLALLPWSQVVRKCVSDFPDGG